VLVIVLVVKPSERCVWVVARDYTVPTSLTLKDLLESFDEDPLRPLELIKHLLPMEVNLNSAEVLCAFYDPTTQTAVIEYSVGGVEVKLVHAADLGESLNIYNKLKPNICRRASS